MDGRVTCVLRAASVSRSLPVWPVCELVRSSCLNFLMLMTKNRVLEHTAHRSRGLKVQ